jgi:hypothetical protein
MLDGSDLKEFGIEPKEGRVPVFARTGQIIANPAETISVPEILQARLGTNEIKLAEASGSGALQRKLSDGVASTKSRIETIENELAQMQSGGF